MNADSSSEIKLKRAANPWKPAFKRTIKAFDEIDAKDTLIEKKVCGILNKLTPDNFDKLVSRVRELPLENTTQFDSFVSMVYEQAVKDELYSQMWAQFCHCLAQISVSGERRTEVKFKNCTIHKCQKEFEHDNKESDYVLELKKQLDLMGMADEEVELKSTLENEEMKMRRRALGNICFIGQLYKMRMLTSPIMMRIIGSLLERRDEESLECLCKLLSTIGKSLNRNARHSRNAQELVNGHFAKMQELVDSRSTSSRVRFLMMNVMDMRKNNWVPRREDAKPKTKAQVHKDIKKEELEAAYILNTPKSQFQRMRNSVNYKQMIVSRPGALHWGGGSSMGPKENDNRMANRYSALNRRPSPINGPLCPRRRFASQRIMLPPLEKSPYSNSENSSSCSNSSDLMSSPIIKAASAVSLMEYTAASKLSVTILEEYISTYDKKEAKDCIQGHFSSNDLAIFVECAIAWVIDKTSRCRKLVGQLLHHLISDGVMLSIHLTNGSRKGLVNIEEYIIDIPEVCNYFGEIYAPLLFDSVLTLEKFSELFLYSERKSDELLAGLVFAASNVMDSDEVSDMWNESGLQWSNLILNEISVEDFVSKHEIQFTITTDGKPREVLPEVMTTEVSPESIQRELLMLFNRGASTGEIFNWINDNVNDHSNKKFIRSLVTAFVESQVTCSPDGSSISLSEDFVKKLVSKVEVLVKYVDYDDTLELQCLFALQALAAKYEHPPGLLEKCFNVLYVENVVPDDIFFEWEMNEDPEEQVGKAFCVASVDKLLNLLREKAEDDAYYSYI